MKETEKIIFNIVMTVYIIFQVIVIISLCWLVGASASLSY